MGIDLAERCEVLAGLAAALSDVPAVRKQQDLAAQLISLAARLRSGNLNVAVLGEFKRGKSSLINALLGEAILPVGVVPLTSVITLIQYGRAPKVDVHLVDGKVLAVPKEQLAAFATEVGNPDNIKGVQRIEIALPAKLLVQGVRLIDTPGVGSVVVHNTATTEAFLGEIDAGIVVLAADQPASQAEMAFLTDVETYIPRLLFVLNKADRLTECELSDSIDFTSRALAGRSGQPLLIFPTSATIALDAVQRGDAELLEKSGLPTLERTLLRLMTTDRQAVLAEAAERAIARVGEQVSALLSLEARSRQLDQEERRAAGMALEALLRRVREQRAQIDLRLNVEVEQMVRRRLLDEIAALPGKVLPNLHQDLDGQLEALRQASGRQREQMLDAWLNERIRHTFAAWRPAEESTILANVRSIAVRYAEEINALLSGTWEQVARVLGTEAPQVVAPELELSETNFRLKTHEDVEILLDIGLRWLRRLLPSGLAVPLLLGKSHKRLEQLVDRHCGRLRHALETQVGATTRLIRIELGKDLDRLVDVLSEVRQETSAERSDADQDQLSVLEAQRDRVGTILRRASDLSVPNEQQAQ
jgi:GTP-binding protein EngB required for normal cell division